MIISYLPNLCLETIRYKIKCLLSPIFKMYKDLNYLTTWPLINNYNFTTNKSTLNLLISSWKISWYLIFTANLDSSIIQSIFHRVFPLLKRVKSVRSFTWRSLKQMIMMVIIKQSQQRKGRRMGIRKMKKKREILKRLCLWCFLRWKLVKR